MVYLRVEENRIIGIVIAALRIGFIEGIGFLFNEGVATLQQKMPSKLQEEDGQGAC